MSIKTYNSILGSCNVSNFFDIYDDDLNKIRFSLKNQVLYITSYNTNSAQWSPANVVFDNAPIQTTSFINYQDILNSNNIRIQLDANIDANGSELLVFEKDNNYNYIKRSGINYNIKSSPYLPTNNLDDRLVIYELDSNGKPRFTLSSLNTNNLLTLSNTQTISGAKTFNSNKLLLKGVGGNITLNGSQINNSESYTLEFPTNAPTGEFNVLTTSGSSPYSKLTWTDLSSYSSGSGSGSGSSYMTLSGTNSNSAANTWSGVNTFNVDKLVLFGNGGNLKLNASQTASSSAYTLEYPTAAPGGTMNVLTTSGSSPYSKYTWTDLSNYLTSATAASTYLTQSNAASTYLTQSNAASTYLTTATASSNYLTQSNAASTYLTTANAASTYLTTAAASSNYLTSTTAASTYLTTAAASSNYLTSANAGSTYMTLSGTNSNSAANTWSGVNTFNVDKLVLFGNGGNLKINASQTASSSAYTLEYPTAAPSGTMNVLTTSGSSPYSKYTWTDLSNYLTSATAASTYLTQSNAASTYLTTATAGSTYLTTAAASSNYLTTANAASTYLTTANAASTYLTTATAGSTYMALSGTNSNSAANTWSGVNTFNVDKLVLFGNGGNLKINASQTALSAAYTLEYPTAAPSGTMNVLTTSGSSPFSKYTWTSLSNYVLSSALDQLSALSTTGSPSFANMTITSGGALNLNYMSTPASSDILATINTNKQLTNSSIALSSLCTLGTVQTITGNKTLSGATTLSSSVTLSGVNSDTATSSGQKLTVLNTTNNAVERVNITPDTLVTTSSGDQTIAGNKSFTGNTNIENLFCSGIQAQGTLSGGGLVKWTGTSIKWGERLICIPVEKNEMAVSGFFDIYCPASGVSILLYDDSNTGTTTGTTIQTTADGIPMGGLTALWYKVNRGTTSTTNNSNFVLTSYANQYWRPSSNWILLAHTNSDIGITTLRWISGMVNITPNNLYNAKDSTLSIGNIYSTSNKISCVGSSATSLDILLNNKVGTSTAGWATLDVNGGTGGIGVYDGFHVQGSAEITSALTLSGTNTDTATSSGQKLAVLNTTSNAVQRVNITPDNLATLSGTQTFSGDKTFSGIVNLGTVNTSGRVSASYTINTTMSFQTLTTLNATGMYLMTASTNTADGTHGLYYICMEENSMIVALSANNFAFQFINGTTLQVKTGTQGFNNCEINLLRLK